MTNKFVVEISTDNAAFAGPGGGASEIVRILKAVISELNEGHQVTGVYRDINGNAVGLAGWKVSP